MGNGSVIRPGDVQRMSAGTGVRHSEYNPSKEEPVHLLQIWILPERDGVTPSYEQRRFPPEEIQGRLRLVASPDGRDGSATIHQGALLYATRLAGAEPLVYQLGAGRSLYLQVARGTAVLNGERLTAGDGVAIQGEQSVVLAADPEAEVLLFDLP
jgi:redox-sensitive bicupin YhaK (pirin superfamily)